MQNIERDYGVFATISIIQYKFMILFTIPTNRNIHKALVSVTREMELAEKISGEEATLLIVDNGSNQNKEKLSLCPYRIFYFNMHSIVMYLEDIQKRVLISNKTIQDLLLPNKPDYGKMFNLIYLFTILLKQNSFHRRDDDCYVGLLDKQKYPIVEELRYIGNNIEKLGSTLEIIDDIKFSEDEKILIVGSDYYGDLDLDVKNMQNSENVLDTIMELSELNEIDRQIKKEHRYNANFQIKNQATLKTRYRIPAHAECGNMCMEEVFRYVPNFIGEWGIGFDSFSYFYSFLMKVPIVLHQNKNFHVHDQVRNNKDFIIHYWIGMIKLLNQKLLLKKLTEVELAKYINNKVKLNDMRDWNNNISLSNKNIGIENLKVYSGELLGKMIENSIVFLEQEEQEAQIEKVYYDILSNNGQIYKEVGEYIWINKEKIIREIRTDFKQSAQLQYFWNLFVKETENMDYINYAYVKERI